MTSNPLEQEQEEEKQYFLVHCASATECYTATAHKEREREEKQNSAKLVSMSSEMTLTTQLWDPVVGTLWTKSTLQCTAYLQLC